MSRKGNRRRRKRRKERNKDRFERIMAARPPEDRDSRTRWTNLTSRGGHRLSFDFSGDRVTVAIDEEVVFDAPKQVVAFEPDARDAEGSD